MTQYLVGYYKPSFEFTRITEFMAIFDPQGTLVGLTGPSTSRQAALDARLFAAAPELLQTLKDLCRTLDEQAKRQYEPEFDPHTLDPHTNVSETLRQAEALIRAVERETLAR